MKEYPKESEKAIQKQHKRIKNILKKEKYKKILDIGARNGRISRIIKRMNPKASFLLIDPDKKELKKAKEFKTKAITFEKYKSKELFDLILIISVLEHTNNPKEFLKKATKCLTKKGQILIYTPCLCYSLKKQIAWIYRQTKYGTKMRKEIEKEHKQIFTKKEIRKLITSQELKIKKEFWQVYHSKLTENPTLTEELRINAVFILAEKEAEKK